MNCFALIAILITTPLIQAEPEAPTCKAALTGLAIAAQTAEVAAEAADRAITEVDGFDAKLESCQKEHAGKPSACAKFTDKLKQAEKALDAAEEELTLALEDVDDAYDQFDDSCSWEEGETSVRVRSLITRGHASRGAERRAVRSHAARSSSVHAR